MAKLNLAAIKALAEQQAQTGPDLNKQTGGDYKPPEAGSTQLRFIEYVETGVHTTGKEGSTFGQKTKPRAQFGFELSGKKHEAKKLDDGRLIPHIIRFELVIGQGKKNDYSKLFKLMVQEYPGRKNFAQLLGEAFRGVVIHRGWKTASGDERVSADLKNGDAGFTITGTTYEDPETNEVKKLKVAPPLSDLRLFLWDLADTDQWDSIHIDGTFEDGNTKNKLQEKIKAAENFTGSPIYDALIEAGRDDELTPAPVFAKGEQKSDVPVTGDDEPEGEPEVVLTKAQLAAQKKKAVLEAAAREAEAAAEAEAEQAAQEAQALAEQQDESDEVDEEAELLAQLEAARLKKAAAKEGAKKAPSKPVAASKPVGKAKVAPKGGDPLQGL
jgi:hypothetical protein